MLSKKMAGANSAIRCAFSAATNHGPVPAAGGRSALQQFSFSCKGSGMAFHNCVVQLTILTLNNSLKAYLTICLKK